ncbi:WecB/TagA/CpsF family glycosyltransferase [Thioalkalivibrio thiocyanodenitrificans]|uniref:WecB/TagA/CpsF family glycosyltransferase n=1 Tax=Thioalkalivibrio thiocyanodenitrificans TaxID=243063 RepID=UPI00037F3ACA|nr:WecB/TagA/CpsF family glycosyltransferase [Thioalkalivibrio thiocyanodenitrificans]
MLGLRLTPMTGERLLERIAESVGLRRKTLIMHHNLHSVYLHGRDARLRRCHRRSDITYIDGMPLVGLARLYGHRATRAERSTALDWAPQLFRMAAERQWRIAFLGGTPETGEQAAALLRRRFPGLHLTTRPGYFDMRHNGPENRAVVEHINRESPDILLVGMGMPRQEYWAGDNLDALDARVVITVGALMDYYAGTIPTPPRWLGRIGLEWLYRLACEPRRLAFRYLIEPWFVLAALMRDLIRRPRKGDGDS